MKLATEPSLLASPRPIRGCSPDHGAPAVGQIDVVLSELGARFRARLVVAVVRSVVAEVVEGALIGQCRWR